VRVRLPPRAPWHFVIVLAPHTFCTQCREMASRKSKVELVKDGSTVVRLYTVTRPDRTVYSVASYLEGKRQLKQFADYAEAKRRAQSIARRLSAGERKALSLADADAWAYERAMGYLAPWNVEVDAACREYSQARHALKEHGSLADAAKFYSVHHGKRPNKSVRAVADELLQDRADRSEKYVRDLRLRLDRFTSDINLYIADITPQQISTWLRGLKLSGRTQHNFRAILTTLFRFAIDQGYLPEGRTAPERVKLRENDDGEIEIFSPAELRKILAVATAETLPYLVLGAFAGIRTAEILRMTWEDVDLAAGFIELRQSQTKTRARRLIPIADNLRLWLVDNAGTTGPVVTLKRPDESIGSICGRQKPPLPWKRNGLRHSYASYRYAITQNENQVAAELGNSPAMVHGHYRQVAKQAQAKEWFGIVPEENK
jgi:integrase